ncbi:MAG: hypothetical protein RIB98_19565 [Acidimicrobiales bacterium]
MRRILSVVVTMLLVGSGCEWATSESSTIDLGWTDFDEPVVFPITVDPSDHDVPPEFLDVWGYVEGWDGQPFSWQCYDPSVAADLGVDVGPQDIEPLEVTKNVAEGDVLRIEYETFVNSRTDSDPIWSPYPICWADTDFLPAQMGESSLLPIPAELCFVGIAVDGEILGSVEASRAINLDVTTGRLSGGSHTVSIRSVDCVGYQQGLGRQQLRVEHLEVAQGGSTPHPPISTVSVPIPYPTVQP